MSRETVLTAVKWRFAEDGYEKTTLRAMARDAYEAFRTFMREYVLLAPAVTRYLTADADELGLPEP